MHVYINKDHQYNCAQAKLIEGTMSDGKCGKISNKYFFKWDLTYKGTKISIDYFILLST